MKLKWYLKQKWQKLTRGYSDEELWNLDSTICKWILPRLKSFKKQTIGYPHDFNDIEEWKETIQKMIDAFEIYSTDDLPDYAFSTSSIEEEGKRMKEGFELFSKYFRNLWW